MYLFAPDFKIKLTGPGRGAKIDPFSFEPGSLLKTGAAEGYR